MTFHKSLEPFDGKDLTKLVVAMGGVKRHQQGGSSHATYDLSGGRTCSVPDKGKVPIILARRAAVSLGMTYVELRARLGCPLVGIGRSKPSPKKVEHGPSKRDAVEALGRLREALAEAEASVRSGLRDSDHYRRVITAAAGARRSLVNLDTKIRDEVA